MTNLKKKSLYNMQNGSNDFQYIETRFDPDKAACEESLFAVGNGYIGVRGYFDEGYPKNTKNTACSTFLNGVYESLPIEYDESTYAQAKNCHRMVDVPRLKFLVEIDGVEFNFNQGKVLSYLRTLDFKTGTQSRNITWLSPSGKQIQLCYEKTPLNINRHILLGCLSITADNFSGDVIVKAVLSAESNIDESIDDPRAGGHVPDENWLRLSAKQEHGITQYWHKTRNSEIDVVTTMTSSSGGSIESYAESGNDKLINQHNLKLTQGVTDQVTVVVSYLDSRNPETSDIQQQGVQLCKQFISNSYVDLLTQQRERLEEFWRYADIQIESDDDAQFETRFALFHLYQSTGTDGLSSIAAKGLTGSGYDGHYFWDSEIYIFPFWLFSHPEYAKKMLEYRVNTLDSARTRAREMGHKTGALFSWRTIGGEECSSYFPAGSAQYHINADIAYATRSYIRITEDFEFLTQGLSEVVIETARIWIGIGQFNKHRGDKFCIYEVTGPDEYTTMVDNNFYTNKLAKSHLNWAVEVIKILQQYDPGFLQKLMKKLDLNEDEIRIWEKAAETMYFPFDEALGVYEQCSDFLQKPKWDFLNTPEDQYPLLLNFHPLVINRYQVLKQADVVLALLLEGEEEPLERKLKCYDYYEPITTHDSTLSTCVYGVMAAEVGYTTKAYDYFKVTLGLDLNDAHNNTYYGLHTAAMGGVWMGLIQGFAGLRYAQGKLLFRPKLPENWNSIGFSVKYKGGLIKVNIAKNETTYEYSGEKSIQVQHNEHMMLLSEGEPVTYAH